MAARVTEGPEERTGVDVIGVDLAVAEVADEEGAGELAEASRRDGQTPGRVQGAARDQPPFQVALEVEHVDEAVPRPFLVVVPAGLLQSEGDVELAIEHLCVERREAL